MTEEGPGFNPRPCQHFSFPVLVKCAHVEFVLTWLTLPDYAVKGMPRHSMRLRLSSSVRMVIPFNSPSKFHFQATHNMHLCILANRNQVIKLLVDTRKSGENISLKIYQRSCTICTIKKDLVDNRVWREKDASWCSVY